MTLEFAVVEQPVLGQIEDQQRAHAVVGEALPHLGEEQHVEALGVAGELRLLLGRDLAADGEEDQQYDGGDGGNPVRLLPRSNRLQPHALSLSIDGRLARGAAVLTDGDAP